MWEKFESNPCNHPAFDNKVLRKVQNSFDLKYFPGFRIGNFSMALRTEIDHIQTVFVTLFSPGKYSFQIRNSTSTNLTPLYYMYLGKYL